MKKLLIGFTSLVHLALKFGNFDLYDVVALILFVQNERLQADYCCKRDCREDYFFVVFHRTSLFQLKL